MNRPEDSRRIRVLFEIVQNYYWPAMKPIYDLLVQDSRYELMIRVGPNQTRFLGLFLVSNRRKIERSFVAQGYHVTRRVNGFDAVICGDTVRNPSQYGNALLCNVDHGPCFKSLRYRNLLKQKETRYVVFAEGPYRMKKLAQKGLDRIETVRDVGLPKLDPFFQGKYRREEIIDRHGLDPEKKIVLFAPTYKPTSLYLVATTICSITSKYNVLVKLHPYSWTGKYAPHSQHRIFEHLARVDAYLHLVAPEYHDIMPYLFAADTMISEASSVINEFLALERCGIIFDLEDEKLKHSDGEALLEEKTTQWLKDSFVHISDPSQLADAVETALAPDAIRRKNLKRDKEFIYSTTDGKSSLRVKTVIEELLEARI